MKETATNVWKDGLNKDLYPLNTPNTVLTDNLNGTFITYNGNELSLQNDSGNVFTTRLSEGFYPIGLAEYGDIIYIASINDSKTDYITASLKEGAIEAQAITAIINAAAESFYTIDEERTSLIFSTGLPLYSTYEKNLFTEIISEADFIEIYNIESRDSKQFELGSFPSLDPTDINDDEEKELDFEFVYRPLNNLLIPNEEGNVAAYPFSTTALQGYDIQHPISIEVQPSYDGSVNLILTDDKNIPRLINSGFSVLDNGKGKFVKRNQETKTNYYYQQDLDRVSRLINNSESFTYVELGEYSKDGICNLDGVAPGGQLKGGNYTFYFKFGDEDGNKTDIVCESGIVSVFKGTPGQPKTISGAFHNEQTDKLVHLTLFDINQSYSRIYVYYTREYCDLNGYRLTECKEIVEPYKINGTYQTITISGVEIIQDISVEELNVAYYSISSAKAIAQQQNMLFLGNVTTSAANNAALQKLSYDIKVAVEQTESIGNINVWNYETDLIAGSEYYDPQNIYYRLGYWPDEIYRFGIVYINSDGTTTQVFNLKGCKFDELSETNMDEPHRKYQGVNPKDGLFFDTTTKLDNIAGVFKTPDVNILYEGTTKPLYFVFQLDDELVTSLKEQGVIGYFIVRQKRLPLTICQGFGVGVDKNCYIPMIKYKDKYYTESFITTNDTGKKLLYSDVSVSGDVVTETNKNNYIYYLFEERWTAWIWSKRIKISVIGPNGQNPDFCYHSVEKAQKDADACKQECVDWCIAHNITLHSRTVTYSTRNYNTMRTDPGDINQRDSEGHIKTVSSRERLIDSAQEGGTGLISVDAMTNPELQSILCGTEFELDPANVCNVNRNSVMFIGLGYESADKTVYSNINAKLTYIPENTPLKYIDNVGFSTQVGDGVNVSSFGFLEYPESEQGVSVEDVDKVVRGQFTPFIGAISDSVKPNILYNIRLPHSSEYRSEFRARANNYAEYYAVSNRISLNSYIEVVDDETSEKVYIKGVEVYRGDCFVNTVTVRMHRNFIDSTAPVADKIVKPDAWQKYYKGYDKVQYNGYTESGTINPEEDKRDYEKYTYWDEINISDLNTVTLGHWLTYRCLSNSNLGLRSEDTTNVSEMALMGNARSFYPLIGASTSTGMKLEESHLLNDGYNATVSRKRNTLKQNTPYDKTEFANRIMFSNVSVTDSFMNGYRTFQGASYQDYTKQYGSIVKLLPWGNNLFCVFEHGIAIIPVNEKALMQTTTEQTIHIYGHGVLPEQLSIVSQDFGSLWPESVIRTPIGIYGVDTSAKKIWKYTDDKGLETISDLKLQRFLNDNINLNLNRQITLGSTNVKTHYNNYKGDVMFTFYNDGLEWNLCYNERQALWVTRYSWIPMFSGNINNTFYSIKLYDYETRSKDISIWKHGRTGIDTKFYPTLWYGQQYPFEFEFVVTEPIGLHKIFEDLAIISNNVQPSEIEFEFIGDDYLFNKARLYHDHYNIYGDYGEDRPYRRDDTKFTKENYDVSSFERLFKNARIAYDKVLDTHTLIVNQPCKNVETYGRRLGNIQYKEDVWYLNIEPLFYNAKLKDSDESIYTTSDKFIATKLRDKWVKVRIKYKGDRLAIVNAVTTFENISYS